MHAQSCTYACMHTHIHTCIHALLLGPNPGLSPGVWQDALHTLTEVIATATDTHNQQRAIQGQCPKGRTVSHKTKGLFQGALRAQATHNSECWV